MEKTEHRKLLESFYVEKVPTRGKGNLSVLLLVTEEARKDSFPLVFNDYLTPERGRLLV